MSQVIIPPKWLAQLYQQEAQGPVGQFLGGLGQGILTRVDERREEGERTEQAEDLFSTLLGGDDTAPWLPALLSSLSRSVGRGDLTTQGGASIAIGLQKRRGAAEVLAQEEEEAIAGRTTLMDIYGETDETIRKSVISGGVTIDQYLKVKKAQPQEEPLFTANQLLNQISALRGRLADPNNADKPELLKQTSTQLRQLEQMWEEMVGPDGAGIDAAGIGPFSRGLTEGRLGAIGQDPSAVEGSQTAQVPTAQTPTPQATRSIPLPADATAQTLIDGQVYQTSRGLARWDAAKGQFIPIGSQ